MPDQNEKELTALVHAALPAFGLDGARVSYIWDYTNGSFRVDHEFGSCYCKVYRRNRHDTVTVRSELLWVDALAEAGCPVSRPRRTLDDDVVWVSPEHGMLGARAVSMIPWIDGEEVSGADRDAAQFEAVGEVLGRVHEVGVAWSRPEDFTRPRFDRAAIYAGAERWEVLPEELRADLGRASDALARAEAKIGESPLRFGLIHGDASVGNVLFKGREPFLIDFDDCGFGYFVSDLATVLAGAWGNQDSYEQNRVALLGGYQRIRPLVAQEIEAIPATMAARAASLIFWAATQTHEDYSGQWERLREYMAN